MRIVYISIAFTVILRSSALKLVNKHRKGGSGGSVGDCGAGVRVGNTVVVVQFPLFVLSSSMLTTAVTTNSLINVELFGSDNIPTAQTHAYTQIYIFTDYLTA